MLNLTRAMMAYDRHWGLGGQADVLRVYGELAETRGRPADAIPPLLEALALYHRFGQRLDQVRLPARLARVRTAIDDPTSAVDNTRCVALLTVLGLDSQALRLPPSSP